MSRNEPPPRAPLPGPDVPSADVLDELLRAFSADVNDQQRLDEIDLTSPEVVELLTPTAQRSAKVQLEVQPEPQVEDEGSDEGAAAGSEAVAEQSADEMVDADAAEASTVAEPTAAKTIVISGDDQLPDAVYLAAGDPLIASIHAQPGGDATAPAAATPEGPKRVFIDDRDGAASGEVISLEAATSATRIEPRMRERRIAVRRAEGRKRLKWAFIVVLGVAVVVAGLAVLGSSLFAIDDVEVEGAVYTDPAALDAVIEDLLGTPVLRADTDAAEQRLEAIPWVEDARVTTDFPHGAKIEIRERSPFVAFAGPDGAFRVIDADGRVLDVLASQPVDYLLLTSTDTPDLAAGQFAPQGFSAAASLVQALTPELRGRAQSVAVPPDGSDLRLTIAGPPGDSIEVRFGAARDLVTKLVRLQTWLNKLDDDPISYIDVSTNEVISG